MRYRLDVYTKASSIEGYHTYEEAYSEAKKIADDDHIVRLVMISDNDEQVGRELVY
jgi:hypothetical protein